MTFQSLPPHLPIPGFDSEDGRSLGVHPNVAVMFEHGLRHVAHDGLRRFLADGRVLGQLGAEGVPLMPLAA